MNKTQAGWITEYQQRGAYWEHDGNKHRPHVELTSGEHSNGFFNSGIVMSDPLIADIAASDLVEALLAEVGVRISSIGWAIGPAMGAITLAHDLARNITHVRFVSHVPSCRTTYLLKAPSSTGAEKKMAFGRIAPNPFDIVLVCEDVLTTLGSARASIELLEGYGCDVFPAVLSLVNRSGFDEICGRPIISLIKRTLPTWKPGLDTCPLCALGSEAIRAKEPAENWLRLTGSYEEER